MNRKIVLVAAIAAASHGWLQLSPTHAEDGHNHNHESHEAHGHAENNDHEDHEDHGVHNDHEGHGHDEHGHEEGKTTITPDVAEKSGVKVDSVGKAVIDEHITLTGRINKNRNTTVSIPARLPSVVEKVLVSWGEKVTKGQELATLKSRSSLSIYSITAPQDGVILERNVNAGDLTEDEALFVIADLSDVWAELHVFPRDLGRIEEGQEVHIKALESDREDTAPISIIMPTADAYSQTVMAIIELPNKQGNWRPGMTVEGDVHLAGGTKKSLVVTEAAIQRIEDQTVVFVQDGDEYEARSVTLGRRDGKYVEVLSGLAEGERYVSEGSFVIKADIGKSEAEHNH